MTPERASVLFRELLQTPAAELDQFARRNGLQGHPERSSLEQAQEILRALMVALQSGPGPNWDRVNTAWGALVAKHGKIDLLAAGPSRPSWVRDMPNKPSLGDPAPGTSAQQQQQQERQRFVPSAKPGFVPPPPAAPAPMPAAIAPPPGAPMAGAPMAPAPSPPMPQAAPGAWPRTDRASYPPPPAPQPNLAQSWHGQQAPPPGQSYASGPGAPPYPTASQPYAQGQPQHAPAPQAYAPQQAGYAGGAYAQPQHGQPQHAQPAHAQPQHGHPQHAGQPYAQPHAHQPQHAQAHAAAQQPHAQQPHAQQPHAHAAPAAAQPAKRRRPPPPPKRKTAPSAQPDSSGQPSGPHPQLQALESNVTTYAAFCAACASYPERVADTQREYGVTDETVRRRIDGMWADRFDDDEDLHAQWEKMFAQFREQIRRR